MSDFRNNEVKDILQIKDEEDFIYGMAYGGIVFGFLQHAQLILGRKPTDEESFEVKSIIVKRMRTPFYMSRVDIKGLWRPSTRRFLAGCI